jgi:hypothetical protein
MKAFQKLMLLFMMTMSVAGPLSKDIEDRRDESRFHKYLTCQWMSFTLEFRQYVLHQDVIAPTI